MRMTGHDNDEIGDLNNGDVLAELVLAAMTRSDVAAGLFRPDDSIAFISPAFATILNVQPEAESFADIVKNCQASGIGLNVEGDLDTWMAKANLNRRSRESRSFETDTQDGRWFLITETTFENGWLWVMFTDITFLKSTESMLRLSRDIAQRDAETDDLTGLRNRRFAMGYLLKCIDTWEQNGGNLCVAIIDIDFFKRINDQWGHDGGDSVLQEFSALARKKISPAGPLCRIGGEEFLAILPKLSVTGVNGLLLELRQDIAPLDYKTGAVSYTFSAGIAAYTGGGLERLLKDADMALYRAKSLGRNRDIIA